MNGNARAARASPTAPTRRRGERPRLDGGGFRKNGVAGLILDNGTHDMTVKGAYFVENIGAGIDATSGITLVQESGFENNRRAARSSRAPAISPTIRSRPMVRRWPASPAT